MKNSGPFVGCLLGTAVGDALGLPYEGLTPARAARLFPDMTRHHLVLGRGMISDDTELTALVARALVDSRGDVDAFRRRLAGSMRWWLLALPAGVGFATLRSILKLWLGVPPERSGVVSAGNGPAMRSAILGVAFGHDGARLRTIVRASTEITHADPRAFYAALGVAIAAIDVVRAGAGGTSHGTEYLRALERLMPEDAAREFRALAAHALRSAQDGEPLREFAAAIGSHRGISGFCYHTVPCVLQAWFSHGDDLAVGLPEILAAGGDTDTAGAIFGAIVGARSSSSGIPAAWLDGIVEWPCTIAWLERLGETVAISLDADEPAIRSPRLFWPAIVVRNLFFLCIVLLHGLRRLLPPY